MSSAFQPPPGVTRECGAQSTGWKVIVASAVSLSFSIVFVLSRLYVKVFVTGFSILALLFAIGRVACNAVLTQNGLGMETWNICSKEMLTKLTTVLPAGTIIYIAGVMFAKLSILVLYYRIFGVDKKFRYTCIALMIIVAGYGFSCCMAKIFRCLPVAATWDSSYKGPKRCVDLIATEFVIGWFSIFTDLAILLLPFPMLWKLRLPRWKKFALSVIFMFGAFACAMSIARQAFLYRGRDTKESLVWNNIVFTLELNVGIICGCLPVLQPLFNLIPFSKYLPSSLRSYFNYMTKGSYRENKNYVKQSGNYSGKSKPTTRGDETELKEYKYPIVSDAGYPNKNSDEDLRSQHMSSGIIRTDRFEVHSEDKV
ncbi:MAG: hypothetical protein Q9226_006849 [Calogaya cf. arnoldii]